MLKEKSVTKVQKKPIKVSKAPSKGSTKKSLNNPAPIRSKTKRKPIKARRRKWKFKYKIRFKLLFWSLSLLIYYFGYQYSNQSLLLSGIVGVSTMVLYTLVSSYLKSIAKEKRREKAQSYAPKEMEPVQISEFQTKASDISRITIDHVDVMRGRDFELFCEQLLLRLGYRTYVTPESGDFGADIIARKHSYPIAVQAKRQKSSVGVAAVQEALSSLNYYQAKQAWVMTNNEFTSAALHLASVNNVVMINRELLIKLINEEEVKEIMSESELLFTDK
jgi:restriction system protein